MRANDLFDAFEALDSEMLYEARAFTVSRRHIPRRAMIAAAIVLLFIGIGVIYGIFIVPVSKIYLDSRESVTITLNSRGNVLSATHHPELDGKPAEEAVAAITRDMLDSGALDQDENTLILGAYKQSKDTQAQFIETVQEVFTESRFHGAIVSLPCSASGGKAAVIALLAKADDSLPAQSLKHLSANDLNLLVHEYDVSGMQLLGEPSESGNIGKDAALQRAKDNSKLTDAQITVTYAVYYDRLVYLVRIIGGDQAEAFFINAADGRIESALRTTPEQLEQEIRTEVINNIPPPETPSLNTAVADNPQVTPAVTEPPSAAAESTPPASVSPTTASATGATAPTVQSTEKPTVKATEKPTVKATEKPTVKATEKPTVKATEKPTAKPTEKPTVKATEKPTVKATEKPTENIRTDSLIVDIPYNSLESLDLDYNSEYSRGQSIPITAFTSCWQWRMNYQSATPAITMKQAIKMGEQDKQVAVFCTYEDYSNYNVTYLNNNSDVELSEWLSKMRTTYGLNEAFFREKALVMVYYSDSAVYPGESDSIKAIETNGDTAYVKLLRRHQAKDVMNVETDVYKCVAAAAVNKTDIKNIDQLKLIVLKQTTN